MLRILKLLSLFVLLIGCTTTDQTSQKGFFTTTYTTSETGQEFIRDKEGFSELAYYDGTWTIGYGNTFYPDQSKVKQGDRITKIEGNQLLKYVLENNFEPAVNELVTSQLTQSQFDALVSYSYNRGVNAFKKSALLTIINHDPNNPAIRQQFVKEWGRNTRFKNGLIRRRKQEAELYFSHTVLTEPTEDKPKNNVLKWIIIILLLVCLIGFVLYVFRLKWSVSLKITKNT